MLSIVPVGDSRGRRSESRSFCAASGSVSINAVASSLSEYINEPVPPMMAMSRTAAPSARGMRQLCSRLTIGVSA